MAGDDDVDFASSTALSATVDGRTNMDSDETEEHGTVSVADTVLSDEVAACNWLSNLFVRRLADEKT